MKVKELIEKLKELIVVNPVSLQTNVRFRKDNIEILLEPEDCKWIQNKIIEEEKLKSKNMEIYLQDIAYLNLTTRAYNALKYGEIETIGHLMALSNSDLLKFYGLGRKSYYEIRSALKELGLTNYMDFSEETAIMIGIRIEYRPNGERHVVKID